METKRLVFSGSGGQGVITAAIILAEAAALFEGLEAVQSQSYGPEARGGATRSDVIISNRPVHYPKVGEPNILVCLTQEAYNRYSGIIRPGGLLLADSRHVQTRRNVDARHVSLPMYKEVVNRLAQPVVFNICVLGALLGLTELVHVAALMSSLEKRLPPRLLPVNRQALELGLELGKAAV
ncbi:NADH-dependent phenylglyoxylate dehydrogenase subunit gamma [Fundidesulfovibrio magnetotacticus]|uniref:NADH-dependent phenylglyoxylate dehydrogenase subunit gamma n=1 Tax=Fundidesulfovibrio magnetotacticus TaxID=2730080 RepID=A0A6V8LQ42_9BACT|nr:2-oxoacid:acceptor oxidoreductase family protein [Fundidesulfovibrio magnetotacticus]GFK92458.1 NADH-dependent phenylglyoxylate dehydrogenase subunit gamma [Fundidesulfovibrio magnetotacticus]